MAVPSPTVYHRWLGWHAPDLRRLGTAGSVGLITGVLLALVVRWQVAALGGWDAAGLAFLGSVWPIILRADAPSTEHLQTREDMTRDTARLLLLAACAASLVSVVFALHLAGLETGGERAALIAVAAATVVVPPRPASGSAGATGGARRRAGSAVSVLPRVGGSTRGASWGTKTAGVPADWPPLERWRLRWPGAGRRRGRARTGRATTRSRA